MLLYLLKYNNLNNVIEKYYKLLRINLIVYETEKHNRTYNKDYSIIIFKNIIMFINNENALQKKQ